MGDVVVIPSPFAGEYVELAGPGKDSVTGQKYPRFRKHLLNLGMLKYGGQEYQLDENWYNRLKDNFTSGVSMVQVPLANDSNKHVEDPLRNSGEVVGIEREGNRVYDIIEVRRPDVAEGLRNKTIMGASAFLSMNYKDTRTDRHVGPALLHHCLTNRPYVLDLEPYQEIVAASADTEDDNIIVLSEGSMPNKEELIAALRDQHGIDVEALQAQASQKADTAALTAAVTEALRGTDVRLTGGQDGNITLSDVTGAIVELAAKNTNLEGDVAGLKLKGAERDVDALIGDGRLLPKMRNHAIKLALSSPAELDEITAPVDSPFVKLNAPAGRTAPDGEDKHVQDIDGELMKLANEHPEFFTPVQK